MSIYKVRIKTEGCKTVYTTNSHTHLTIMHNATTGKYELSTPKCVKVFDTAEEADKIAREKITALFTSLGIVPNFIDE